MQYTYRRLPPPYMYIYNIYNMKLKFLMKHLKDIMSLVAFKNKRAYKKY